MPPPPGPPAPRSPPAAPGPDWLQSAGAECLATRLRRAGDRQAGRLRALLREAGLPDFEPGWWPLFRLVAERRELAPGEAAAALGLSPAAISQTAAALLRAGLLAEQNDPRDARRRRLLLSAAGQHLRPRLQALAQEADRLLGAALGDEAAALRRALQALDDAP